MLNRAGFLVICAVVAGLTAATPARAALPECQGETWIESTLYMGRGLKDGRTIDDATIRAFIDETVVPLFPDGFTVLDARGHWRDGPTGRPINETTVVLVIAHPPGDGPDAALRAIAETYIARFRQSAVLQSSHPVCVTFHSAH